MSPAMRARLHAPAVLAGVDQRLAQAGSVTERHQLRRMSMAELDLVVLQELGLA